MSPPVRVLRVLTRLNVGGPARQAVLLHEHLRPEFESTLAVGDVLPGEAELSHPGVDVVKIPLHRNVSPLHDARAGVKLRALVSSTGAQIIHSHMAKAGALARTAGRVGGRNVRTVHTFHGHVFDGYFSPRVERVFVAIERRLARVTDAFVAVSDEIRDQLLDRGIGRPNQYHVIPEGQDLAPYLSVGGRDGRLRRRLGLLDDTPLVGIFGRVVPIKDHATLVDAVARLEHVHLAVLGDGELRASLEERAQRAGLAGRVHFLGWVEDVAAALADVDVVALTSRNEGTPVALIEALAAGRSVVATDVGGVRSVVDDGVSGVLVPPADDEAIAAALKRLLADADLRTRMGAAGRDSMRARYGHERLVSDTRRLYEDLLAR